ncbi:uncharacterized protein LOC115209215 [Octopus sinensis]|uniref:Uncharacterized protein LOC115209215 n=1 Tax=Octopus sinensis TaxID=2607531 RepID=A0A6P7S5B2_9MOLL|nr:uncharacterized protein LOC115209215 [Octopus sinensis]XP_036357127.1 uncharacterized protein LOC115209215 [Octopus sinensis]XP_036357128.1 uncharacterized protein LOC115209215 [Octopus sinensis]
MSENTNSAHIPASHRLSPSCLSPPSSLDNLVHTTSDPHSSLCSIAHTSSETALTMGNQLSGDGSLKRKSKKKNKNKNDDKSKSETTSVLDETAVGAFGGSSVDDTSPPNKRPAQTKSPRPVRSTYDNVNQHGSNSNLCSNSGLYTSDLYLDTVSRLDVSMTTSQMETTPRNERSYRFDTQLADDVSFSEISFNESGFITPALSTPQVRRNELQQITTTTDSVSELGKEIERTIFERLSADGKSDGSKVKSAETPPLPSKQDVEENVGHGVDEKSKRLEYINEGKAQTEEKCAVSQTDMKAPEENSTGLSTCQELTTPTPSEEEIWSNENSKDKEKSSEMINKADWELMEKESKISVTDNTTTDTEELIEVSQREAPEKAEHSKKEPNQNYSSSDETRQNDFEQVKLHINEDVMVSLKDSDHDAPEREGVKTEQNGTVDKNICPETPEQEQKLIPPPDVAANQKVDAILMEEPVPKSADNEIKQVKQSENQCLNEKVVETKTITDDKAQLTENCEESILSNKTEYVCEAEKCSLKNIQETAAAVIATKPSIPDEILTISEAVPVIKNTSVKELEPVCEKIIESSSASLAERSKILVHHPVLSNDQEKETEQIKTSYDESSKKYIHEPDVEANSIKNESDEHSKDPATQEIEEIPQGAILETESSLECSVTQTTDTTDDKKETSENEQNISKTKTKKGRKRKRKKKSSLGNESSANASASESQSVSEVTEIEDNCDLAISRSRGSDLTKEDEENGNDIKSVASTPDSDSPVFLHQSSVIENPNYLKDESSTSDKSNTVSSSEIQKKEQADQDINSKPHPFVDVSCSVGALHSATDIVSDESTPTNERQNEIRAFYIPNKEQKIKSDSSHGEGTKDDNKRFNDQVENVHTANERTEKEDQELEDGSKNINQQNVQCEDENETHQCEDENENVFDKDEDATVAIPHCRNGTKNIVEETVNPRLSTASEELNEIMENSNKIEKRSDQNRPHSYPKEGEDLRDRNENHPANSQVSLESNNSSKKNSKSGHKSLTDIDHNLPETLPELADLKNFLDYIKLGEDQKLSESHFPYKCETNRSSPSENASSRRLSRISPAVTDRSVTESDIDISEQRDDISTDSNIFADDEDESASELLFTKTYTEPDKGGEVLVSCTVVNTAADDDSDDFWAEHSASEEVYRQIQSSTKVVTTVFDNARLQMQDIHTHLQNLRLQMENLQESLDNASIFSHEYYPVDDTPESSQDFYPLDKGFIVSQEYFPKHIASVTTEEYSPVEIGPVLTEEYYSSHFGKPPFL